VRAAADGVLDETHWVELKQMIAPGKPGSVELARDLASLAADGGLLVVGVEDDGGKAGAVVGTEMARLADRVDQAARDRVHPPLVVRTVELHHPQDADQGCLLVVVDASPDAPHMVDGRYWGRGSTGKRVLTDVEVRRRMQDNDRRREDFAAVITARRDGSPLGGSRVLHLVFRPRAGRRGALAAQVDRPRDLLHRLTESLPDDLWDWHLEDMPVATRVWHGVQLTNFRSSPEASAHLKHEASERLGRYMALTVEDDGTTTFACSRLAYTSVARGDSMVFLSTEGLIVLTGLTSRIAGRIADEAGYGGTWDVGVALTALTGAFPEPIAGALSGLAGARYREDRMEQFTATTSTELAASPEGVVRRLLQPGLRLLGAEGHLSRFGY
jgi:hypothetical protein